MIIGSGFSSLAVGCYLAKEGYSVIVLEKNEQLGGRASLLEIDGFKFDMGPSWYWMPDIFEKFFSDFGKKVSDYYQLTKLSPAYRVYFGEKDFIDIADEPQKIIECFEQIEKGSGQHLSRFLADAKENYEIAMNGLVYNPGLSITELINWKTIKKLDLFVKNISTMVKKNIKNTKLQTILEFPVLFLGAKPQNTPAFYNFMNHADFGMGTWYPDGGFHKVSQAMVALATELGVEFKTNEEVIEIKSSGNKVVSVRTSNHDYIADIVVSGADYAHTETLLGKDKSNYSPNYWAKKTFAPSSLLYYVGFDCPIPDLLHHNLFFDTDFELHSQEIYDQAKFPTKPLFYANFPSKTDANLAPKNCESAFFLIPVAVDLNDTIDLHEYYFEMIMNRIQTNIGKDYRNHVVVKKSFGINDFKKRYHSCRGNAYGLANTLLQTSVLRPRIVNKHLKNMYYTGQLTVPGPGVPPAIISGKIVSDYILKQSN